MTRRTIMVVALQLVILCSLPSALSAQRVRMAVLPFRGAAPAGSDLAFFGPAAQSMLTTAFAAIPALELVERERLDDISGELMTQQSDLTDPASRVQLGRLLGVRVMLFGSFFQLGDDVRIDARMVDVATGRILHAEEVTDSRDRLFGIIRELTATFAAALARGGVVDTTRTRGMESGPEPVLPSRMIPAYGAALRAMDEARVHERDGRWSDARAGYEAVQKQLVDLLRTERNFTAAKEALRRAERKIREIDYVMETGERIPVRIWALVAGVNAYRDTALPRLRYASPDAVLVDSLLSSPRFGAIPPQRRRLHIDTAATRAAILADLDYLLKASSEDDVILIYFAGHGMDDAGSFYFMGSDGDHARVSATGIAASQINDMIHKMAGAKKVLWLIDACYAGSSGYSGMRSAPDANDLLRELARSDNGYAILSASNEYEKALEFGDKGHGIFTYFVAEGVKGLADAPPSDGYVRLRELAEYVSGMVQKATNGRQTPLCFGCENVDFPVARIP